ncbi:MAG: transporter [Magnetovibrio sp.]|nr:transporter [Magnetovibrio sp.]
MLKPLLFASLAAIGNAIMVYGQRATASTSNPFFFIFIAIVVCGILFGISTLAFRNGNESAYFSANWQMMAISGFGFFLTFVGFFLLFNNFGATQYTLYAVISIITTTLCVGVLIFKEDFNFYHATALIIAIIAIALFTYGNAQNSSWN